ncbi:MAG TPA: hypothetical protein VGE27_00695 [Gemmatimonas sp.]|uniref:hypothetical protein n=1 Tax=Gemmatimonas sp. TaxID=1962908 RepID=UPI002ED96C40
MTDPSQPSSDDTSPDELAPTPVPPAAPAARRSFFRRHWLLTTLVVLIGLPVIGVAAWSAVAMSWSYSSGKRAGYVQKIARKGYVCKTWEGTLYTDIARGFRSDSFTFTVRSDSVAHAIEALSGERVAVHYEQHVGIPTSCFGETEYFVTGVERIPD